MELAQSIEKEETIRVTQTNLVDEGLVGSNPNSENNEVVRILPLLDFVLQ